MQYEINSGSISVVFDTVDLNAVIGDAARIDVGEAVNYIKSGEKEIEQAVATETAAFNLNAQAKATDFNNNASDKLNAFNQNATDKTNAFNQNASDKTDAFNLNASNKTTDFNNNYTAKKALIDAEVATASGYAADAKQWAIGDPSEPVGNSAKYWADEAATMVSTKANVDLSNLSATGEAKFIKSVTTGATNGTISVDGTDVSVYGLGSAAYTASTDYATSAQGALADTAVQPSDLSTYVTTNTAQDITARKTFFGEKSIYFKQNTASNKLGFTLCDYNNKEVGALEFRPNSIDGTPILTLNSPSPLASSPSYGNSYVGFRYWNYSLNILAPFSTSFGYSKNFFIPVTFTNGTTTVESTSTDGSVDISSLLPTKTSDLTNDSGYITSSALTPYALSADLATVATTGVYSDLSGKPTVDQTYNASSTNAQSGVSVASAIDTVLAALYPIGSIYIGTQSICPLATLISGSTWELVATDKALWGGDGTNANTTIAAGLPNITGYSRGNCNIGNPNDNGGAIRTFKISTAAFYGSNTSQWADSFDFDASRSSSVYGNSTTVQPPAYRVNVWRRTA